MKRLIATLGSIASGLALVATTAMPAHAAGSSYIADPAGDQYRNTGWAAATTNARNAADLRGISYVSDGSTVHITWEMQQVLPDTNTTYYQDVYADATMSGQNIRFQVLRNGTLGGSITYGGSQQCPFNTVVWRNTTNNTIHIEAPLWCLPAGLRLNAPTGSAYVNTAGGVPVGQDDVGTAPDMPF